MATNLSELRPLPSPPVRYRHESVLVTPEMARAWLGGMRSQRRLRNVVLAKLRRIVGARAWRHMPHGLVFSPTGVLLDGQHRLNVIVETGEPQWLEVCHGCPPEYYGLIGDVTATKTGEDVLRAAGCPLTCITYAGKAVRMLWRASAGFSPFSPGNMPTNEEMLATYHAHREVIVEAGEAAAKVRELCSSPGTATYVLALGLATDPEGTRAFARELVSGANLAEDAPALLLRNTWMQHRTKGIVRHQSDLATEIAATLNGRLRGKGMRSWRGIEFGTGKMPPVGR